MHNIIIQALSSCRVPVLAVPSAARLQSGEVHVWEVQEITFEAGARYANPYADVDCWVELEGPGFRGASTASGMAAAPSRCASSPRSPANGAGARARNRRRCGLNGCAESFARSPGATRRSRRTRTAAASCAPARTATRCATPMARRSSWSGTPGWPHRPGGCRGKGARRRRTMCPAEGISFEEAVAWRKRQGFNSSPSSRPFPTGRPIIAAPPSPTRTAFSCAMRGRNSAHWAPNAKISTADGATTTAKDMHDEQGNRPFEVFADREGLANFDRINPRVLPQPRSQDAASVG